MNYKAILITDNPPLRTITLHRPERRNAMTPEMQMELIAAMEDSVAHDCRVLVFRGSGNAFCSGLDLTVLKEMMGVPSIEYRADAERIARLFLTLYELPIPTIAVVHGQALAGGTGLATICDFTFATPDASFGFTEVRRGFVPALVSAFLALQLGDKRSRDLLLTGRIFSAEEALALGLVNQVLPQKELEARLESLTEDLCSNSSQSLKATKTLLAAQNRPWLDLAIEIAIEANTNARDTTDFREGISAFLEKRKPIWSK